MFEKRSEQNMCSVNGSFCPLGLCGFSFIHSFIQQTHPELGTVIGTQDASVNKETDPRPRGVDILVGEVSL